ncbi:MAG: DNA methyltransferase [Candidatus Komeilibacteria bacterium]|nr:DNA methyltransferase [Candidatus Komeilibacteria bacterium]
MANIQIKTLENVDIISNFLRKFTLSQQGVLFDYNQNKETDIQKIIINGNKYQKFINEYWTSKQRQANSLHEISYRACFKPQLPRFFIELLTKENDTIYDPFNGRGTTVLEAALLGRNIIGNDINPLSTILSESRLFIPDIYELNNRLEKIIKSAFEKSEIDLTMFYHHKTLNEIISLRNYLKDKKFNQNEDNLDKWIRMVATNRLTGHSSGFFSVYTLPPNQAVSPGSQIKINQKRNQIPEYRNIKEIILNKTNTLIKDIDDSTKTKLLKIALKAHFFNLDARNTPNIKNNSVKLIVTSPPFLDVVQYTQDNWLRCWFNNIDVQEIEKNMTMSKTLENWCNIMQQTFNELYRIVKNNGWVAFEVGEIKNGTINLDEYVVPMGEKSGFECKGILINEQKFTKTANIWGIKNNSKGTNSNRIVIFCKH